MNDTYTWFEKAHERDNMLKQIHNTILEIREAIGKQKQKWELEEVVKARRIK